MPVVEQIAVLALQLGTILFAAKTFGIFAKKLKLPPVLGELIAGIVIGPCLLGGIALPLLGLDHGLFGFSGTVPVTGAEVAAGGQAVKDATVTLTHVSFQLYHSSLYALATIGSVMLLFMSGLETDLRMFFRYSLVGTIVGLGGVIISFMFGDALGVWLLHGKGLSMMEMIMHPQSLFLGILSTATSVGITARILSEKKKIDSPEGVTILAAAVIDDVLGIICLAIVMGIVDAPQGKGINWAAIGTTSLKCVAFWLIATAVGLMLARYIAKFFKLFKNPAVFGTLSFGLALILAGIFEANGLAMIIGAYVMGLSLSKTDTSFAVQRALEPVYNFLVPVFFVVMGMLVDIRVFTDPHILKIGLFYALLAIAAKIIGCALPSLFMNFNILGSLRIGTGMVPRGEVALIIAGIGMSKLYNGEPILTPDIFGIAIIMTLATTILAPPLLSLTLTLGGKGVRKEEKDTTVVYTPFHFRNSMITEFILRSLQQTLESEGYLLSRLDKDTGVMQIRKDNMSFAMNSTATDFVFESNQDEVPFIRTLMFETIVTLHKELDELKKMATPMEIRKDFFSIDGEFAPENKRQIRSMIDKGLNRSCIIMDLQADTKEGVICELIDTLDAHHLLKDRDQCTIDVLDREGIVSTCLQDGVALPHGRSEGVDRLVAAVGISRSGYCFDSMDGKPSKIFVLCISPKNSDGPHIEFIATIGTILAKEQNIQKILAATTPNEVFAVLDAKEAR